MFGLPCDSIYALAHHSARDFPELLFLARTFLLHRGTKGRLGFDLAAANISIHVIEMPWKPKQARLARRAMASLRIARKAIKNNSSRIESSGSPETPTIT